MFPALAGKRCGMENSVVEMQGSHSTNLLRGIDAIENFVKSAFNETKKDIGNGLSFFKEELAGKIHRTGDYLNAMVLPVNNFLKDVSQIEKEFAEEQQKNAEYCIRLDGKMVPASTVLNMHMEENY